MLKPKHHFFIHYVHYIKLCGPLVNKWALRFEGKHRYFKRIPAVVPNYKNVGKTFVGRDSLSQFLTWRTKNALKSIQCGSGKWLYMYHLPSAAIDDKDLADIAV